MSLKFPYDQKEIKQKDIVFFAKDLVRGYSDVTEPNLFPNKYEAYIPLSKLDEITPIVEKLRYITEHVSVNQKNIILDAVYDLLELFPEGKT